MRALLVRVGADSTPDGGGWNAPVDSENRLFAYVPIPEGRQVRTGGGDRIRSLRRRSRPAERLCRAAFSLAMLTSIPISSI
jgi:hypothetical protein